jgi:hypothetical protein
MKQGPRPNSRPWMPADDAQLLALLESKIDRPSIARKLKRTVTAISARLKMGELEGASRVGEFWPFAESVADISRRPDHPF